MLFTAVAESGGSGGPGLSCAKAEEVEEVLWDLPRDMSRVRSERFCWRDEVTRLREWGTWS